jgi:hypothetical protein
MLFSPMLQAHSTARLPSVDAVTVVCDRCHRPGWSLEVSEINGDVVVDGARINGADGSPSLAAMLRSPRAHRYRAADGGRPGAFILTADGPAGYGTRDKLVCIGRRHPRYERVVTHESAERAYTAAVAAGRTQIRLSEMSARP